MPANASQTKTVAVLGASYGGYHAAQYLAKNLPEGWRVVVVDRNSHVNHVYVLPRYGVLPGHEHKAFIPYTRIFQSDRHIQLHARATALSPHAVTLSAACPERGLSDVVHFDYAIYALGSHLPAPIDLWGAPPSVKTAAPYAGSKGEGVAWLRKHQKAVEAAESVLVVGGGALGIQYASDIAAVHPGKKVTLLHSRLQLLPRFDPAMHSEILEAMRELGVEVVLGERLDLASAREESAAGRRVVRTVAGREIAADLLLLCTGQQPNTELLEAMDSRTVVHGSGLARVLRTLQLGVGSEPEESAEPTPYPHIFAIGDAADAFGAINAGHIAYRQGELAARNIVRLVNCKEGVPSEDDELERYEPSAPGIKVTVGLKKSVFQMHGVVGTKRDGLDDLDAGYMWGALGFPGVSDEDMRL
ncbi:hypothetical protein HWV62_5243 [Athelia sp. TMB]|nr:hypothetical protein HWV62_5243 [Athelia sp. TMB]